MSTRSGRGKTPLATVKPQAVRIGEEVYSDVRDLARIRDVTHQEIVEEALRFFFAKKVSEEERTLIGQLRGLKPSK